MHQSCFPVERNWFRWFSFKSLFWRLFYSKLHSVKKKISNFSSTASSNPFAIYLMIRWMCVYISFKAVAAHSQTHILVVVGMSKCMSFGCTIPVCCCWLLFFCCCCCSVLWLFTTKFLIYFYSNSFCNGFLFQQLLFSPTSWAVLLWWSEWLGKSPRYIFIVPVCWKRYFLLEFICAALSQLCFTVLNGTTLRATMKMKNEN